HHLDLARELEVGRQVAAGEEHDAEVTRQRAGERERAHEVAQAELVVAVEEEPRRHATSSRPAARMSSSRARPAARTRVIDRSARSPRSAAAVYQWSSSARGT